MPLHVAAPATHCAHTPAGGRVLTTLVAVEGWYHGDRYSNPGGGQQTHVARGTLCRTAAGLAAATGLQPLAAPPASTHCCCGKACPTLHRTLLHHGPFTSPVFDLPLTLACWLCLTVRRSDLFRHRHRYSSRSSRSLRLLLHWVSQACLLSCVGKKLCNSNGWLERRVNKQQHYTSAKQQAVGFNEYSGHLSFNIGC